MKLKPLYVAMLSVLVASLPLSAQAAATVCNNTAAATIDEGNCIVETGTIPITVNFVTGATGSLILNGEVPTGAVTNTTDGEGAVQFIGNFAVALIPFGVATSGDLLSFSIADGKRLDIRNNLAATTINIGVGSILDHQQSGTVTTNILNIGVNGIYNQTSTGTTNVLNATNVSIAAGGDVRLRNQNTAGTVTIDGAGLEQGLLRFFGDYNPDAEIGGTFSLQAVFVNPVTLTLDDFDVKSKFLVIGTGGTVNHSDGTVTLSDRMEIQAGTYTQSGAGTATLVNQNLIGTMRIRASATGQGNLIFAGDWDTDATIGIVSGFNLNSITVNSGVTLILDQAASATTITINGILDKRSANGITGATTVNNGGSMTVAAGFTHTGALTIGQGTSGSLSVAGNTVNVTGTFNMGAGATFNTTINSAAADDAGKIVSTGAATVPAGTTINIDTGAVTLVAGTTYKVIDGDGSAGINVPTTIIDNNANFNFVGSVVSGDLLLTVQAATLVQASITGLTPNATAVAGVIDALITSDPEITTAFSTLSTTEEFNDALESLAPDMSGAVQSATFAAHHFAIDNVEKRLASLRTDGMMAGMAAGDPYQDVGMWLH